MKAPLNFVVYPRWLIQVVPHCKPQEHRAVVVRNGSIADILSRQDCKDRYPGLPSYELPQHLLIPGLINMHGHAAMSLLRGYADDVPLESWLNDHIWPAEQRWVDDDFVRDGTLLSIAEMIRGGTTSFADNYFFPNRAADAAVEAGMRCQITFPVIDFATGWARNAEEYLHKGLALYDQYHSHPLIKIGFGPHAPYTVSDTTFQRIATLAEELQAVVQIHLHESAAEIAQSLAQFGERPIERLERLGILGPRTQCVHMTQSSPNDIALLKKYGSHLVHCPSSNLKLASGFCPVGEMQDAGINVCLGTDGPASNNRLDMLQEARFAALLAKSISGDATKMSAEDSLRAATIAGARAMGMEQQIGSIETGKEADMIAVRMEDTEICPLYDPLSQLIYAASASDVTHSWVRGRMLMENRRLVQINLPAILARARRWSERIKGASND